MRRRDPPRTVYSSEHGRLCPDCGKPIRHCVCRRRSRREADVPAGPARGIVRVGRTSRGRGGKTVTTITGVALDPDALRTLASELKRLCGTGGAVKKGVIEIQGDQRDRLIEALRSRGFEVKRSGG